MGILTVAPVISGAAVLSHVRSVERIFHQKKQDVCARRG